MPFNEECNRARRRFDLAREAYSRAVTMSILDDPERRQRRIDQAQRNLDEARENMERACENQLLTIDLPGGTRINQEAGVPDGALQQVKELIDEKIPTDDVEGLAEITLSDDTPPEEEIEGVDENGRPTRRRTRGEGEYSGGKIKAWYPPKNETIKHEIGHHVHRQRLSEDERRAWKEFWTSARDRMPTDYARVDASEGFAEVYEHLRDDKELDDEVRTFMIELAGPNPPQ